MALATTDDVEALSGEEFDDETIEMVDELLPLVQGEIEFYLNRAIEPATFTNEQHTLTPNSSFIYLQNTPVSSVTSVKINGYTVDTTYYVSTSYGVSLIGPAWGYAPATPFNALWLAPTVLSETTYVGGLSLSGPAAKTLKSILIRSVLSELTTSREGDAGRAGYSTIKVEDFELQKARGSSSSSDAPVGSISVRDVALLRSLKRRLAI